MTVGAKYDMLLQVTEAVALGLDLAGDASFVHEIASTAGRLSSATTPAISAAFSDDIPLSGGAFTLDLAALTRGSELSALDMTGLKVQAFLIRAKAANGALITVTDGLTNGYLLFGDAAGQVTLDPGDAVMMLFNESLPDVGGSAKTIDFAGTGTDAFEIIIVAG